MKRYKAIRNSGISITTVIAKDKQDAIKVIECQLKRPGRFDFWKLWIEHGKLVQEITD